MEPAMIHDLSARVGYILHEQARVYYGSGTGFLSIKSFYNGKAEYAIGSRRFAVSDSSYFILNNGQLTDICFAVGFASLGSFSWWFRRKAGVSPTGYRSQNR
jgi:AraC-like DNA-binding protein